MYVGDKFNPFGRLQGWINRSRREAKPSRWNKLFGYSIAILGGLLGGLFGLVHASLGTLGLSSIDRIMLIIESLGALVLLMLIAQKGRSLVVAMIFVTYAIFQFFSGRLLLVAISQAAFLALPGLFLADAFNSKRIRPCKHDWIIVPMTGFIEARRQCKKCGRFDEEFGIRRIRENAG